MRSIFSFLTVIAIIIPSFLSAQKQTKQTDTIAKENTALTDTTVYEKVEIDASFPGGDAAWKRYLQKTLTGFNPAENGAGNGVYKVIVQFVVDKDGNISDVKALTYFGHKMEEKVIEMIKKGPKWNPAILNGKPVKAFRKQPVTFVVEGS